MTELLILLPMVAFVALAAGTAIVLRRAGRIVARTREIETFRSAVRDLAQRAATSLDGAAGRIDAVRRGQVGAEAIADSLRAASEAIERYAEEARALSGPPVARAIREQLVEELERAGRALAMVDYGAKILAQARRRGREVEAQTAIKRGYLNLLHAREAIDRHADAADALVAGARPVAPAAPVRAREPRS